METGVPAAYNCMVLHRSFEGGYSCNTHILRLVFGFKNMVKKGLFTILQLI